MRILGAPVPSPERTSPHFAVRAGLGIVLLAATFLAFRGVSAHAFLRFDDPIYVTDHPVVKQGWTAAGLRWAWTQSYGLNWHPLTWMSHMLDVEVFGLEPAGPHVENLVLHGLSVLALYVLLSTLTKATGKSFFAALLFAVHPQRVESVSWISERKDVLSLAFGLLATLAWVRYARSASRVAWCAAFLAFAASLASKAMLVTLPFVWLLLDVWPLERASLADRRGLGRLVLEKLPFFLAAAAISAVAVATQSEGLTREIGFGDRLANVVVSYGRYLAKAAWPVELSPLYPRRFDWPAGTVALAGVTLAALTALALVTWRRAPAIAIGWFWFLGALVPVVGVVHVGYHSIADRYTYFPHIGLVVAVIFGLPELARRLPARDVVLGTLGLVAGVLCLRATTAYHRVWGSTAKLFSHALEVTEANFFAHTQVAALLAERGRLAEAQEHNLRALEIDPTYALAWMNLARVRLLLCDPVGAIGPVKRALALEERLPGIRGVYRDALVALGEVEPAEIVLRGEPGRPFTEARLALDPKGDALWLAGLAGGRPRFARGGSGTWTMTELERDDVVALALDWSPGAGLRAAAAGAREAFFIELLEPAAGTTDPVARAAEPAGPFAGVHALALGGGAEPAALIADDGGLHWSAGATSTAVLDRQGRTYTTTARFVVGAFTGAEDALFVVGDDERWRFFASSAGAPPRPLRAAGGRALDFLPRDPASRAVRPALAADPLAPGERFFLVHAEGATPQAEPTLHVSVFSRTAEGWQRLRTTPVRAVLRPDLSVTDPRGLSARADGSGRLHIAWIGTPQDDSAQPRYALSFDGGVRFHDVEIPADTEDRTHSVTAIEVRGDEVWVALTGAVAEGGTLAVARVRHVDRRSIGALPEGQGAGR